MTAVLEKDFTKKNGVHYTPTELSNFMAQLLYNELINTKKKNVKILDPACGDGELLYALSLLLIESDITFELIGVDIDNNELIIAKNRLNKIGVELQMVNSNYLDVYLDIKQIDLIIANPPYVRTQNQSDREIDKTKFMVAGRFDLYQLFLYTATESLADNGILCIITSNKYLFNKSGEKTRLFLNNNYEIKKIIDLGDSKLFSASVLPAIFLGNKQLNYSKKNSPRFAKVYETKERFDSDLNLFESLINELNCIVRHQEKNYKIETGTINNCDSSTEPWRLTNNNDDIWLNLVISNSFCYLEDWANVKVGIKTTADKVFLKKSREDFSSIENNLIYELFFSKNVGKWFGKNDFSKVILYPYILNDNKTEVIELNDYPKTKKYLIDNEEILKKRKYFEKSSKKWYEIWVPHSLHEFNKNKIVVPDISSEPRFMYDSNQHLVDGNCYWITLKDDVNEDYLFLILGLCNSKFITKYHDLAFQNKLYSGKRRYISQYLNKYPMINPNSATAKKIVQCVKNIVIDRKDIEKNECEIEKNIEDYFMEVFYE